MYDANLISDYIGKSAGNELYFFGVGSLTWQGHEFLDMARNDTIWKKAFDIIKDKGGNVTLEILKVLLPEIAKKMILG